MPRYGTIKRQYPRVEVLRGFNPNEPHTFTQAYPVQAGVAILSGQVVSAVWNGALSQYEWQLGWSLQNGVPAVPFVALNDSGDPDVIEAGNLAALSSAGQFEIETAFFKAGDTFLVDVPVGPDGVTGNIKVSIPGSGVPIMGYITRNHGPKSLVGINSNAVNLSVVSFQTAFGPSN